MTQVTGRIQRTVDADHPWLGLSPFTTHTRAYFYGRDRDIRDLFLRVRDQSLTTLFGQSGLGKTSLLGAGLIPKLQVEGFRACMIRIGFESSDSSAVEQTLTAASDLMNENSQSNSYVTPVSTGNRKSFGDEEPQFRSLWEFFHLKSNRSAETETRPLVLIFDQFEEIFTLADTPKRLDETHDFFCQLADLIENRPPHSVQQMLRLSPEKCSEYDLSASPVRVVITLREDFLSRLEDWKQIMPSLMRNRVGLRQLAGPQALEAVVRPGNREGRCLVSEEVGAAILRFVAKRPADTRLEEISAVPPLLSLLCEELNEARLLANAPEITFDLVHSQSADILQNFYTRSFDQLSSEVRRYVEDRMVTVGGHRNPVAREDALAELGAVGVVEPDAAIDQLILRRLLSSEERGGVHRLEITHDVLAPLVVHSRDQRRIRERAEQAERERELSRRQRVKLQRIIGSMIALTTLAIIAAGFAVRATFQARAQTLIAEQAKSDAELATIKANEQEQLVIAALEEQLELAREAAAATTKAKEQEELATARLEKQIAQAKEASSALFSYGLSEYGNNRYERGVKFLNRALELRGADQRMNPFFGDVDEEIPADLSKELELASSYKRVLVDRLTRGGWSWGALNEDAFNCIAFSPDGRRVATGSLNNLVQIWDAKTGIQIGESMLHGDYVYSVVFSPDGKKLASGSKDKTARLWDSETCKQIGESMRHAGTVYSVAFSPDGAYLATASEDRNARLWDVKSSNLISALKHIGFVSSVAFSPDGKLLATASWDKYCRIWDTNSKSQVGKPIFHSSSLNCVAFSPDGKHLATGTDGNTARLWDLQTGAEIGKPMMHAESVETLAFSPDGAFLATGSRDKTARLWDAYTSEPISEPIFFEESVSSIAFSPDGMRLATVAYDKTRIWNAQSCSGLTMPKQFTDRQRLVAISPDGMLMAACSTDDRVAGLWNINSDEKWGQQLEHDFVITSIVFSPDGRYLATGSGGQGARLWDMSNAKSTGLTIADGATVTSLAFSPDGSLLATGSENPLIKGPDGNLVQLWDIRTGEAVGVPMKHEYPINGIAFSPNGKRLASASGNYHAILWDINPRDEFRTIWHDGPIAAIAFSPDGRLIGTASKDKTARLWDAETLTSVGEPMRHDAAVNCVAFSADSKFFATGSDDGTARIWDSQTGASLGTPLRHQASVFSIAFTPDCNQLATGSSFSPFSDYPFGVQGGVTIWDIETIPSVSIDLIQNEFSGIPSIALDSELLQQLELLEARRDLNYRKNVATDSVTNNKWSTAEFHLPWLCQQYPEEVKWKEMLARTYAEQDKWKEACKQASEAVRLHLSQENLRTEILCNLQAGGLDQAKSQLAQYLSQDNSSTQATAWIALNLAIYNDPKQQWERLCAHVEKTLEAATESAEIREAYAASLYRLNRLSDAEREFKQALASHEPAPIDPLDPFSEIAVVGIYATHAFLAMIQHRLNNPEKSAEHRKQMGIIDVNTPKPDWQERLRRKLLLAEVIKICGE